MDTATVKEVKVGNYADMSRYYDTIMTAGYYQYNTIVDSILDRLPAPRILEVGCGTGLILEGLARSQKVDLITGIDLTQEMLAIAQERLQAFSNVNLLLQNVIDLSLDGEYDLAFSYGGVWYFVIDGNQEPFLVSHIPNDDDNHRGFAQLAKFIRTGGRLLLGIQGPHHDYEKNVNDNLVYSQKITDSEHGFIKDYYLFDKSGDKADILMQQTLQYRTYSFAETQDLFQTYGFEYQPVERDNKLFLEFIKR